MSATPGARDEYSRGSEGSRGVFGDARGPAWRDVRRRRQAVDRGVGGVILAGAFVGAVLLVAAELTALYDVHLATRVMPIQTVSAGSHNSYAMIPIAAAAAGLGIVVWRSGTRLVVLGIGVLGLVALLIALLHDLPDAQAVGLAQHNTVSATSTPRAGLYMETLGAILLIATGGLGLMLLGAARRRRSDAAPGRVRG